MTENMPAADKAPSVDWNKMLAPYRNPVGWKSIFQLANTALLLALFWFGAVWSLKVGYWLTLILSVPAAFMIMRLFMLQHDCGHGSFFRSQRMNNLVGGVLGVFTLVPYAYWRRTHAIHHATSGNLDVRGLGDIDTLTVKEYLSRSRFKRMLYRMYRHPTVLLLVGPTWQFILKHRMPLDIPRGWKREIIGVQITNIALFALIALMWWQLGIVNFLKVQLPITLIAGSIGVFLFYVQHQYEDTYWRYREKWNYYAAGLEGASHLTMPRFFQWCTASIGLHHIHHIASRIPNYELQRAYDENAELRNVTRLSLWKSISTLRLTLWDEDAGKLVRFRDLRAIKDRITAEIAAGAEILATKPEAVPVSWR
jgi:omega-6 fatty acid desaturase (delta-12 desaturase)